MSGAGQNKELENLSENVRKLSYMGKNLEVLPTFLLGSDSIRVKQLNLTHNKLKNLGGLESFCSLEELTLDNNLIDDRTVFPAIPTVKTLTLTNNNLVNLEDVILKISSAFPNLTYLSLLGNKACPNELSGLHHTEEDYQNYRFYVSSQLLTLQFLDFKTVSRAERIKGCRMFNVPIPPTLLDSSPSALHPVYSPLPKTGDSALPGQEAVIGRIRYRYVGKRSEGNRFIRNKDL